MELDSIAKQLNAKFAEPLPEFSQRRIIFWNDEDGDFADSINELVLDNAKVVCLSENNNFAVKKLLSHDDLTNNYLLYVPIRNELEDDWLLDIKLFSEDFRADQLSIWLQEMNIASIPAIRDELKNYKQFLNAAARRKMLGQFGPDITTVQRLYLALLAAVLKTRMNPKEIIKAVMIDGDDLQNDAKMKLLTYSLSDKYWSLLNRAAGFNASTNINDMNNHIFLSAASQTLGDKVLNGLESKYSSIHSTFCYEMIFEWIHSDSKDDIHDLLRTTENRLKLKDRFDKFEIDDLAETEIFPCIDEVIIEKLIKQIINKTISTDTVISSVEKRRTMAWHEDYEDYYAGVYWAAKMLQFQEKYTSGFHFTDITAMWKAYCDEMYLMDTYYRQFYVAFNRALVDTNDKLDDPFKTLAFEIEKLYKNWFLSNMSHNWTTIAQKELKEVGAISKVNQQESFYERCVKGEENKVFVIISDALRYEVAASLAEQLRIETKSDVTLTSQQAQFPTITKFGMAALLPHKQLSLENKSGVLRILADGKPTEAGDRETILKSANSNSVVVKYKDLILLKREEKRNLIKGMNVVYIYHDTIDNTSHHDEPGVFGACDKAIDEIKNLVKMITNELNGLSIVITADHGFLYTYEALCEDDKLDKSSFKKDIIEQDRRHIITDMDAKPDFMIEVKGFYNNNGYKAFSPREAIRLKGSGSLNFVHGGASLQEMVVPVIQYKYLRSGYKSYLSNKDKYDAKPVTIALLSSNRKVSNMIFNFNFYQKEAVGGSYVPCTYKIFLVDSSGNTISDVQTIIADRTSTAVKEREYRCTFNLKQQAYNNTELYYLIIQDEEGIHVPTREEIQIDIAMSFDDFDFFG